MKEKTHIDTLEDAIDQRDARILDLHREIAQAAMRIGELEAALREVFRGLSLADLAVLLRAAGYDVRVRPTTYNVTTDMVVSAKESSDD